MPDSQTHPKTLLLLTLRVPSYQSERKKKGVVVIEMRPVIPSWNKILGEQHWDRDKRKKEIQTAMLSALSPSAPDYSTKTICAQNMQSIFCATAERFLAMRQERQQSRQRSARLKKAKKTTPK
jgi:hypothetical protein